MPLPLLAAAAAAAATPAATLFSYNRQNFLYDKGQQVTRAFTGLNYKLQQFALYRQDIRDLVGLTTDKMSNYHVVACLELGMCATLMGPARLKADVPEWVLWHQLVCLCAAFAYLVSSMWFATRAAVAADSFNVRLQTQWIRLPVPDDELLDSALTRAEAFETEGLNDMLRVPLLTGMFRKVFNTGSQENAEDSKGDGQEGEAQQGNDDPLRRQGSSMGMNSFSALQMYQQLQRNWSCYDAYARVAMSVGTYWLAISLAYYQIGWTLCHQHKGLPAVAAAMMFSGVIILLVYVDIFASYKCLAGVSALVIAGPGFAALGASLEQPGGGETHWCSIVVGAVHLALSFWFWHVGSIVPGKADLPTRFKGVVYLDIFGPIVRQIRGYLDQTGLGQHAVQISEDAEDEVLVLPSKASKQQSPTSPSGGAAVQRWGDAGNASRAAEAIGLSTGKDGLQGVPTESGVRREIRRVRQLLLDWKDGAVMQHLGPPQQQELLRMVEDVDGVHRHFSGSEAPQMVGLPVGKHYDMGPVGFGSIAGSHPKPGRRTVKYQDFGPVGFAAAAGSDSRRGHNGEKEPPTILRSLSASSNGPHSPVWTRIEHKGNVIGTSQDHYEYWVGSGKATKEGRGRACFNDAPPKDAPYAEFQDVQALCGEVVARAESLGIHSKAERCVQGAKEDGSPSMARLLGPRSGQGDAADEDNAGTLAKAPKGRHRKGHQPVVAFRVMCGSLVLIWLIGMTIHAARLPEVRAILVGRSVADDVGSSRRLGGPPLAAFSWPEPFFRPRGLHCVEPEVAPGAAVDPSLRHIVASNGFLVYRLESAGSEADSAVQLACPVEEHDSLVSSSCDPKGECRAVVAAAGGLWECHGGREQAHAQPFAALPASYRRPAESPLVRWAAAGGSDLEVFFAAPRQGAIVELRRRGGELQPVAELPLGSGAPDVEEWLALATARAGEAEDGAEEVLLAVASPGPSVFAWSLSSGRFLGASPLRGAGGFDEGGAAGWCPTQGGALYSASATEDGRHGGVELSPWPVPRSS